MKTLQDILASEEYVLLDGPIGTTLMAAGLEDGSPPEAWNVLYPERVRAVHRGYIDAGSRIILTNSFGGTSYRLKLHNLQDRVAELNRAGAVLAREEADRALHPVLVGGSMGPTGELLEPLGTMTFAEAKAAFAEQAAALADGGVDVLWIETMSDLNEVRAAVEGARSVSDLPVTATMSFDTNGRTMMGVAPVEALEALRELDLMAIGANCGANLPDTEAAIAAMHTADPDLILIAKANAGIPRWEGGQLVHDGTPEIMAGYAQRVRRYGAQLIGSCCGGTVEHIRAMAAALKALPDSSGEELLAARLGVPDPIPPSKRQVGSSGKNEGRRRQHRRR